MFKPNKQQLAFIESDLNIPSRVMAGPGSGKTASIVARVDYLIRAKDIDPSQITVVSYTRNAANEVGERALKANKAIDTNRFCTIHALSFRAMRNYEDSKLKGLNIAKSYDIKKFAKKAIEHAELIGVGWKDFMTYVNAPKVHCVEVVNIRQHYHAMLTAVDWSFVDTEEMPWASTAHDNLYEGYVEFARLMKSAGLMTFADMLYEFERELVNNSEFLSEQRSLMGFLIIDEAQDTNPQAMRILMMLANNRTTLVGDADQSIFGFIGARPENNLWYGFEELFPKHETYMLETNYRSTRSIVALTNKAIAMNYDEHDNKYRKIMNPDSSADKGVEITHKMLLSPWEEAKHIAASVEEYIDDEDAIHFPGDIYVVARTRAQLPYVLMQMFKKKIPAATLSGLTFWDLAHIQDLLAYMRLSIDKKDAKSLARVYNKASLHMKQPYDKKDPDGDIKLPKGSSITHRWLGKAFLAACDNAWSLMYVAANEGGWKGKNWIPGIDDLHDFMKEVDAIDQPGQKARYIVDKCLASWWAKDEGNFSEDGESTRSDDMETIVDIALQLDEHGDYIYKTTQEFLDYLDDIIQKTQEAADGDRRQVVLLSTIHGVKGSERDVVYVMGVCDGLLPHWTSITNTNLSKSVLPTGGANSIKEERRLFYVAISRAAKSLYLTGCYTYRGKRMNISRFVHECELVSSGALQAAETVIEEVFDSIDC